MWVRICSLLILSPLFSFVVVGFVVVVFRFLGVVHKPFPACACEAKFATSLTA
jgi:hypothetical protein